MKRSIQAAAGDSAEEPAAYLASEHTRLEMETGGSWSSAFLLVRTFDSLYGSYGHPTTTGPQVYSIPHRLVTPGENAKKYRGLDREPVSSTSMEVSRGRVQDHFLQSLRDASDASVVLGAPSRWEVVWVQAAEAHAEPPLRMSLMGYEPNYFPGGCFSPLCDCMCLPRCHGTDREGILFKDYHMRLNDGVRRVLDCLGVGFRKVRRQRTKGPGIPMRVAPRPTQTSSDGPRGQNPSEAPPILSLEVDEVCCGIRSATCDLARGCR